MLVGRAERGRVGGKLGLFDVQNCVVGQSNLRSLLRHRYLHRHLVMGVLKGRWGRDEYLRRALG